MEYSETEVTVQVALDCVPDHIIFWTIPHTTADKLIEAYLEKINKKLLTYLDDHNITYTEERAALIEHHGVSYA